MYLLSVNDMPINNFRVYGHQHPQIEIHSPHMPQLNNLKYVCKELGPLQSKKPITYITIFPVAVYFFVVVSVTYMYEVSKRKFRASMEPLLKISKYIGRVSDAHILISCILLPPTSMAG